MRAAAPCQPLLNLLSDEIRAGEAVNIDETTLQVLREPGRDPTSTSYMWVFRRGDPDREVLIYQYDESRGSRVPREFLADYRGYVQTDGYKGYDFLDSWTVIRNIGCWDHARRKFMDVIKARGEKAKTGSADVAVNYIRKLYQLEREAQKRSLSPAEIFQLRQEQGKPILDEFHGWLEQKQLQTPPKGLLGKAVSYTLRRWHRLVGYLEDGQLSPDNNKTENCIRPFVVSRKNWLFRGTPEGAEASTLLYSLIETARPTS